MLLTPLFAVFAPLSVSLFSSSLEPRCEPYYFDPMPTHGVQLDVDNYPVAPPELALEQVHLYVRHGAHDIFQGSS